MANKISKIIEKYKFLITNTHTLFKGVELSNIRVDQQLNSNTLEF